MNLGLSIFLSTIIICLIWLYYITRDRWNWKKIIKWSGISAVIICLIIMGVLLFREWYDKSKHEQWKTTYKSKNDNLVASDSITKTKVYNSLRGINLREIQKDVKYFKGNPLYKNQNPEYWGYEDEQQKGTTIYKIKYIVVFKDKNVIAVIEEKNGIIVKENVDHRVIFLEEKEFEAEPTSKFDFDDDLKRLYLYSDVNRLQVFEKGECTHIGIYLPEYEDDVKKLIFSKPRFLF